MTRTIYFALLLVAGVPAMAENYAALFDEAAEAIEWNFKDNWAFTETRLVDGKPWVARFDPRLPGDRKWTLLFVDGRPPTEAQFREFLDEKDGDDSDDDSDRIEVVNAETLELIDETDTRWIFRFDPEEDASEFVENVDASVRIRKDGPWVEVIEMHNNADIEPGFGTKIRTFLVRMEFGRAIDNGPVVPKLMDVELSGRTMLFIGFSENERVEYSNFVFAGEEL
jgi:hypothetical protein